MKTKEKHYWCIGVKRRCGLKESQLTELSKKFKENCNTLVGETNGIWIFDDKKKMQEYLKKCKTENNDGTVVYKSLDMGTEMPKVKPSQLISA